MEHKIKHLEMIESIINRMGNNSFLLKGWAVTLLSGIFVLSDKDTDKMFFLVAYIPIIVFWLLDSYYLFQERLFRYHYDKVRDRSEDEIDFSMQTNVEGLKNKDIYWGVVFSTTERWFYLPLALVTTLVIIITNIC